jgi:hypothetical protein
MESTSSSNLNGWTHDQAATITVSGPALTNTATGRIEVLTGAGEDRVITGNLINHGQIMVEPGIQLAIDATGREVIQAGTINGEVRQTNGSFTFHQGSIDGSYIVRAVAMNLSDAISTPTTIRVLGGSNSLIGAISSTTVVWLDGNTTYGTSSLNILEHVQNLGTIRMESTSSSNLNGWTHDQAATITVSGPALTNTATGRIEVLTGAGEDRVITGNILNHGSIRIQSGATLKTVGSALSNYCGAAISGGGDATLNNQSITNLASPPGFVNFGYVDLNRPSVIDFRIASDRLFVTFDTATPLAASTVRNLSNYQLVASGRDGAFADGNEVNFSTYLLNSIQYDPATRIAEFPLTSSLPEDRYLLTIKGQDVEDINFNPLYDGFVVVAAVRAGGTINPARYAPSLNCTANLPNLLENGSFEYAVSTGGLPLPGVIDHNTGLPRNVFGPPTAADQIYTMGNGALAVDMWIAAAANPWETIDWVHSANYAASHGQRSIDLNGTPGPGGIAQYVQTIPGIRYRLEFDMAGNPLRLGEPQSSGPFTVTMDVSANQQQRSFSFLVDESKTPQNPGWIRKSWEFTAQDQETILTFLSTTPRFSSQTLNDYGPTIDNVKLVQLTDYPSTYISETFVYHGGSVFANDGLAAALDTSKSIARETSQPTTLGFDNLINTSRGINGLVFDIPNLPEGLSAADFHFHMSPQGAFVEGNHPPASWETAPPPSSVTVIPGSTPRVLIEWPDNAIRNRWLRIGILANENTGLFEPEYYYIGHLMGETTGPTAGVYTVNFADITGIRSAVGQTVNAGSLFDIDKNGTVTFSDISAMRSSIGIQLTNITVSAEHFGGIPSQMSLPLPGFNSVLKRIEWGLLGARGEAVDALLSEQTTWIHELSFVDRLVATNPSLTLETSRGLSPWKASQFEQQAYRRSPSQRIELSEFASRKYNNLKRMEKQTMQMTGASNTEAWKDSIDRVYAELEGKILAEG